MTPLAMGQFSWYSGALAAHEDLEQLTSQDTRSTLLTRLVEQIKQWEVGFLGLLGGNEETSKMQDRLGIEIIADEESSGDILTRRWKVIQQRSDLPKWTGKDAVKVCSFYCLYRLLDACAFTDGIPASVPNRPRRKLRIKISSKQSEWIKRVEDWPQLLLDFKSHLEVMEGGGTQENPSENDNACVRIVRSLSALDAGRQGSKVAHNFLVAAMHIAYIKQTNFRGELPDIPDSLDQSIETHISSHLTQRENTFLSRLFVPSSADKMNATSVRVPLQLSLTITPLFLLHTTLLTNGSYNRAHVLELSLALGSEKPSLLLDIERQIWKTLFILAEGDAQPLETLKGLKNNLPWEEIEAVKKTPVAAWFHPDYTPNTSVPSSSAPSAPVTSMEAKQDRRREISQGASVQFSTYIEPQPTKNNHAPGTTDEEDEVNKALGDMVIDEDISYGTQPFNKPLDPNVSSGSSGEIERSREMDVDQPEYPPENRRETSLRSMGKRRERPDQVDGDPPLTNMDVDDEGEPEVDKSSEQSEDSDGEEPPLPSSKKSRTLADESHLRKSSRLANAVKTRQKDDHQRQKQEPSRSNAVSSNRTPRKKKRKSKRRLQDVYAKPPIILGPRISTSAGHSQHDPIYVDLLWDEVVVDPYAKVQPVLDTIKKPLKFRGEKKIVAYTPDGQRREYDPFFHFHDIHTNLRTFLEAAERNYHLEGPRHMTRPDLSCLAIMTEKEFEDKGCREISNILRRKNIVTTSCATARLKFDARGLRTLKPLHSIIPIQDLSVPIDGKMEDRVIRGTLQQLLDSANDPDGKILNGLDFPFWKSKSSWSWESFATDLVGWEQTACEEPWSNLKTQMNYPIKEMRWGLAATAGALSWQHIDSDGQNTVIENVGDGDKLVIVLNDSPTRSRSSIDFFLNEDYQVWKATGEGDFEAIVLSPGTRLIMRANTPHVVLTSEATICYGGHFYATATMQDTMSSLIHSFVCSDWVTNASHFSTRLLLRRIAHFYYLGLVKRVYESSPEEQEHLPDLLTFEGVLDLLSLCNLVILGNVLDHRTYSAPNQDPYAEANAVQMKRIEQHDHNAIPFEEREASVYARGLCIQMLHWFVAHFEIRDSRTGKKIDENIAASHLARQAIALQAYKKAATANKIRGAPHCTLSNLKHQIQNALTIYDDAYHIWKVQEKSLEVLSLAYEHDDKENFEVVRKLQDGEYQENDNFAALGCTEYDKKYFANFNRRMVYAAEFGVEEEEDVQLGKRKRS